MRATFVICLSVIAIGLVYMLALGVMGR
jgi:hypothetical protein